MVRLIILSIALMLLNSTFALNPSRTYKQRPEKYNMQYKEHKVTTSDGAELNAWAFSAKIKTTRSVLICHNGEGNMADYLRRVDQFVNMGYHVVIFDYRGFGESDEFEIDNQMYIYPHFLDDLQAMKDFMIKTYGKGITVYGWGIGAGLALGTCYGYDGVEHIIADSPFLSMEDLEEKFSTWDEPLEVPFAGYDQQFEPFTALQSNASKTLKGILLITADDEPLNGPKNINVLKSKSKAKKLIETHSVGNASGKDHFRLDKAAYMVRIKEFCQ